VIVTVAQRFSEQDAAARRSIRATSAWTYPSESKIGGLNNPSAKQRYMRISTTPPTSSAAPVMRAALTG
jgi:hypothetical protein